MTAVKGVDISEMNGSVDFTALRAAGVEFVMIRCGYGGDYPGQQDTEFENNVRKAGASGMPWGAYHYGYAADAAGGRAEAAHALRLLGGRRPAYGVWYDMEDASTLGGDLAGAAEAFCSAVESVGLYAGVYANLNWFGRYLTGPVFDRYDRWCAQYHEVCQLSKPYGIWQFTDRLVIGGKVFDGNWAYKDYPALTGTGQGGERVTYEEWLRHQQRYERETAEKPVSGWAEAEVERARTDGLMNGDAEGGFRPQSPVTRQELAAVMNRAADAAVKRARED